MDLDYRADDLSDDLNDGKSTPHFPNTLSHLPTTRWPAGFTGSPLNNQHLNTHSKAR
jgi:hypothetical protein